MKSFLCTLFALSMSCALWAYKTWTDETGLTWKYEVLSDGTVSLWGSVFSNHIPAIPKETVGKIIVPSNIDGKVVTKLGEGVFTDCTGLTSVTLPDGITSIGSHAFSGCSSLVAVNLPDEVTSIGTFAFDECCSLSSVSLPSKLTSINSGVFRYCKTLTSVKLPVGVSLISDSAFAGCYALVSLDLSAGVAEIENAAFSGCIALQLVTFHGTPPQGVKFPKVNHGIPLEKIRYPKAYAKEWIAAIGEERQGLTDVYSQALVTATAEMVDSTQMKVTYTVSFPEGVEAPKTVNVRAVAFKDGVRSFANIVPVVTNGTAPDGQTVGDIPNGNAVNIGAEYAFVWDISKDWASSDVKLGQVSVEILVQENGKLLPQELITIPEVKATKDVAAHPEMTITRNVVPESTLFKALLWRYAELAQTDKGSLSSELAIVSNKEEAAGKVYWNKNKSADFATDPAAKGVLIAWGDKINDRTSRYSNGPIDETALLTYLYRQMGFEVLAGENLDWAREATRLSLRSGSKDSGDELEPILQRAVKVNQSTTPTVKE